MFEFWINIINILYLISFKLFSKQLISFGIVGISGILIQFLCFFLIDDFINLSFFFKNFISVIIGTLWGYYFNNLLTFKNEILKGIKFFKGIIKFLIISTITIFINVTSSSIIFNTFNHKFLAIISGIIFGFFFNFFVCRKIIWNKS